MMIEHFDGSLEKKTIMDKVFQHFSQMIKNGTQKVLYDIPKLENY